MRLLAVGMAWSLFAHADVAVPLRTPLGPQCDDALHLAQQQFNDLSAPAQFHVRQRTVDGGISWSDMCGVWGEYSFELAPDRRAPHPWRWKSERHGETVSQTGSRLAGGWRARFRLQGDDLGGYGARFVAAFRPALDVCLSR